ncbi:MAG: hypothetical protein AAGF11_48005 [Myxococcota bacterium]
MLLRKSCMGLVGLTALVASCQIKPGEYRVYRVANEDTVESTGCYPSDPGEDITGDSTTVRVGQTFGIFAADSDVYFLDFEMASLAGSRDGKDYSFSGETVDVMILPDPAGGAESRFTSTSILDVNLTIDGKKISGTSVLEVTTSCTGGAQCPDPANTTCTTTTNFQGSEVKDVELEHGV